MKNFLKINVQGTDISIILDQNNTDNDYICLTDIANRFGTTKLIDNWIQNKNTIEFLGVWEDIYNKNFNSPEFRRLKTVLNEKNMSIKKWATKTNAIGIYAKTGKYGGTYAHKDIAMAFCGWISPEFQLYIIKEFQRLKKKEEEIKNKIEDWDVNRKLTKVNYRMHTDAIKYHIVSINPKQEYWAYVSNAEMLNKIVFGITSTEFKKQNPQYTNSNMREAVATTKQLIILANLEALNAHMIREGLTEKQRFDKLTIEAEEQKKAIKDSNFSKALLLKKKDVEVV